MDPQGSKEENPPEGSRFRVRAVGPVLRLLWLYVLRRDSGAERGPGVQEGVQVGIQNKALLYTKVLKC